MDVAVASLIGSGLSLSGGLFSNRTNRKIAEQNLAYQREANEKNMQLVREANANNIAFQQRENEITRMREDNAVQRAAEDMTAAGLSKTLAAGNPASASALSAPSVQAGSVSPVNNSYRYESALQKMNIAQLLQDMSVKDEQLKQSKALNDANIELIKAQAENYNNQNSVFMQNFKNEQFLKLSQVAYNNVRSDQARAETELTKIIGESKAQDIQSQIDLRLKQIDYYGGLTKLNQKSLEKMCYEIANEIAKYHKLSEETKLVIKDLAYKEVQIKVLNHDLGVGIETGLPVGTVPGGLFGSPVTAGLSLWNIFGSHMQGDDTSSWIPDWVKNPDDYSTSDFIRLLFGGS